MELFLEQQTVREDNNLVKLQDRNIKRHNTNQTDNKELPCLWHWINFCLFVFGGVVCFCCFVVVGFYIPERKTLHNLTGKKNHHHGKPHFPQNYTTNSLEKPPIYWNLLSVCCQSSSEGRTETKYNPTWRIMIKGLTLPERQDSDLWVQIRKHH